MYETPSAENKARPLSLPSNYELYSARTKGQRKLKQSTQFSCNFNIVVVFSRNSFESYKHVISLKWAIQRLLTSNSYFFFFSFTFLWQVINNKLSSLSGKKEEIGSGKHGKNNPSKFFLCKSRKSCLVNWCQLDEQNLL